MTMKKYDIHFNRGSYFFSMQLLSAGSSSYNEKWLFPRCDFLWHWGVRRIEGMVFCAREEAQEWSALKRHMVANRSAQHWVACLERVEDRSLCNGTADMKLNFAVDMRERSQMIRKHDADCRSVLLYHGSVWTSTDSTGGRSRTIGDQLSPASAEAYTCPPLVPK